MTATTANKSLEYQWYHSMQEVTRHLDSNLETGLTSNEAVQRQNHFGCNELKSKPEKSPWVRFLLQFNQPLLYILPIAGVIKVLLGSWRRPQKIMLTTVVKCYQFYNQ